MIRETWFVNTKEEILRPEVLAGNPDKYGGMSMHMISAVHNEVVTIPLVGEYGGHVSIQATSNDVIDRILADGRVDILSEGYWCSIRSEKIKVVYFGTDEEIPMWRGGIRG